MQLSEEERERGRRRLLVRQSRAGRGDRREAAGDSGDHRHAVRCAGAEGRGHARRRAPRSSSTTAGPRAARKLPRGSPARQGATVVPSFDDPHIVAGQGTVGLEILEQLARPASRRRRGSSSPAAAAGLRRGLRLACPDAEIVIGRARGLGRHAPLARSWARSCRSARMRRRRSATRCRRRGCRRSPSASCASARREAAGGQRREVAAAVRWAWNEHQLVVEPGGAVALAALLAGKAGDRAGGRSSLLSGGNVDPALHARLVGLG